tara:strand:+ start:284 stop:550 length:267 start_codon:yes stop_codon:yes gene_type:complete
MNEHNYTTGQLKAKERIEDIMYYFLQDDDFEDDDLINQLGSVRGYILDSEASNVEYLNRYVKLLKTSMRGSEYTFLRILNNIHKSINK